MSKEEIEKEVIKNAPQKIYLQIGEDVEPTEEFDKLVGVSWCEKRINENDIEYIMVVQPKKTLQECKEEVAKRRGYLNWLEALTINWSGDHHIFWNELCELYLQSNQSGWSDEDMDNFMKWIDEEEIPYVDGAFIRYKNGKDTPTPIQELFKDYLNSKNKP